MNNDSTPTLSEEHNQDAQEQAQQAVFNILRGSDEPANDLFRMLNLILSVEDKCWVEAYLTYARNYAFMYTSAFDAALTAFGERGHVVDRAQNDHDDEKPN